jgi:hypothetical protein
MTLSYIIYITLTLSKRQTVGRVGQVSLFHASLPPHLDLSHFLLLFILWILKNVRKFVSTNTPTTFNAIIFWRKGKTESAKVNDNNKIQSIEYANRWVQTWKESLKKMRKVKIFGQDSIIQHVPLVRIRSLHNVLDLDLDLSNFAWIFINCID